MKSTQRLITLFMLAVFILTILAACAGEETQDNDLILTLTADAAEISEQGLPKAEEPAPSEVEAPPTQEAQAGQAQATQVGQADNAAVANEMFEVRPDGFGFRNYGAGFPEGDFTIADLRSLFGDGVCSRLEGDQCIPTADAQQWISDRNADMLSGHCIGFTVASYRFFDGYLQPSSFSEDAAAPFDIAQEAAIMRTIAANGSLYWVESVWRSEVSGTPQEVLQALIALDEPVDLSIFLPGLGGGHSLLAYDVLEVEPDLYHILTYDNNFPGEESFVEVDLAANTWRYDQGAVNPDQEAVPYEGDATTETLRFIPLTAYENVDCPFCPAQSAEDEQGDGFSLLSFLGRGQALVTTDAGSINLAAGQSSNEMPGAQLIHQRGQLSADDIPDVALPAGNDFNVQFQGVERVSSLNRDFSMQIDGLPASGDQNQLSVDLQNQSFVYQPGGNQSPILKMTIHQGEITYDVSLLGVNLASGQDLSVGLTPGAEGLAFFSEALDINESILLISRLAADGESIFSSPDFNLTPGQGLALDISNWNGQNSINQFVDSDGDGNFDQQLNRLANEQVDQLLQGSDPSLVGPILNSLSPYLNEQELESVLVVLPGLNLSAQDLGRILQPLNLSEEQLLSVITAASLPVDALSELIFTLRLDQEAQDLLIADLGLAGEDLDSLQTSLSELAGYHQIFLDWAFIDSDDPADLAAFLRDQNLTAAEMVGLLPRLALNPSQTASIVGDLQLSGAQVQQIIDDSEFTAEEVQEINALLEIEQDEGDEAGGTVTPTQTGTPLDTSSPTATSTVQGTVTATPTTQNVATASPTTPGSASNTPTAQPVEPTAESTSTPVGPPPAGPSPTAEEQAIPSRTPTPEPYPG